MKETGIVRKIDNLGRIVIPKELRDSYHLDTGTPVEIFTHGGSILLQVELDADSQEPRRLANPLLEETLIILSTLSEKDFMLCTDMARRCAQCQSI